MTEQTTAVARGFLNKPEVTQFARGMRIGYASCNMRVAHVRTDGLAVLSCGEVAYDISAYNLDPGSVWEGQVRQSRAGCPDQAVVIAINNDMSEVCYENAGRCHRKHTKPFCDTYPTVVWPEQPKNHCPNCGKELE